MLQFTVNAAGMNTETTVERDIFKLTGVLCLKLYQDIQGGWEEVPLFTRVHCPDLHSNYLPYGYSLPDYGSKTAQVKMSTMACLGTWSTLIPGSHWPPVHGWKA